jgi:hypothetical protein
MIERVAKAMCDTKLWPGAWEKETEGNREEWRMLARAAIEAMHNPSDEMLAAGVVELSEDVPNQIKAAQVWWEMIDAALEGK